MDILLLCRDAQASSIMGNLLIAMEGRKHGIEVAVMFTQEALAGVAGQALSWPLLLRDRDTRMKIAANAKKHGMPIVSSRDSREIDVRPLIAAAKDSGVTFLACPIWTRLLGLEGKLPPWLTQIDAISLFEYLKETKKLIGCF